MKSNLSVPIAAPAATLALSFRLEGMRFGLPFSRVAEVRTLQTSMPVLHAPDYRIGMVVLHGRVLPLVDLRVQLGKPSRFDLETRLIVAFVARAGLDDSRIGILVDAIDDVVSVPTLTEAVLSPDTSEEAAFVSIEEDTEGGQLFLLDVDRLNEGASSG